MLIGRLIAHIACTVHVQNTSYMKPLWHPSSLDLLVCTDQAIVHAFALYTHILYMT